MNKLTSLATLLFMLIASTSSAQSFTVPSTAIPISLQNATYYNDVNVTQAYQLDFIVCQDIQLTFNGKGTQILRFFLEPYAHLILSHDSAYFSEVRIFAKNDVIINYGNGGMTQLYVDTLFTGTAPTIIDSAGKTDANSYISFNNNTGFTYGGFSPCFAMSTQEVVSSISKITTLTDHSILIPDLGSRNGVSYQFDLFNLAGQLVYRKGNVISKQSLDVSSLPRGLYVYNLSDTKGSKQTGKIVLQ